MPAPSSSAKPSLLRLRHCLGALVFAASLVAAGATGLGCNMITGAGKIVLVDDDDSGSTTGSGVGGSSSTATAVGGGSNGSTGQGGDPPLADLAPADGVSLTDIVVYQAVSRPIMSAGSPVSSNIPVVAGRDALIRIFYDLDGGYNGQAVEARLTFDDTEPLVVQGVLSGSSSEGNLSSTINFMVPGELMLVGSGYRVEVLQDPAVSSGTNAASRYPNDETSLESLGAQASGRLKITLVPVKYNADGSGRLPDTSSAQLQRYEDLFMGMYPITGIDLSVRNQPLNWSQTISAGGSGWSDLLNAVASLRANDGAPSDTYYYGIFEPKSTFSNYCQSGCVAGLGFLGGPQDSSSRAAIGLGYGGDGSVETAVHELGHNHGREHAPCGVSGDASYPYSGASIGVYGYDMVSNTLFSPNQFVDMMSYCNPTWISDYNFREIFQRVQFVAAADVQVPPALMNLTYQRVAIDELGAAKLLPAVTLERPPVGEAVTVSVQTSAGEEQLSGQLVRYDHLDGGVLWVPPSTQPMISLSAMVDAKPIQINP